MFENKFTQVEGIRYSRYIASWLNIGEVYFDDEFIGWLARHGCTNDEIADIREMATCGKLELETDAEAFLTKNRS